MKRSINRLLSVLLATGLLLGATGAAAYLVDSACPIADGDSSKPKIHKSQKVTNKTSQYSPLLIFGEAGGCARVTYS